MQISRGAIDALGLNGTRDGRDIVGRSAIFINRNYQQLSLSIYTMRRVILRYYIISSKEDYA
jgi:hypothetical protein